MEFKKRLAAVAAVSLLALGLNVPAGTAAQAKPTIPPTVGGPTSPPPMVNNAPKPVGVKLDPAKHILKGRPGVEKASPNNTPVLTACGSPGCYTYTEMNQDLSADPATRIQNNFRVENTYLARTSNNTIGQNESHTLEELAVTDTVNGNNIVEIGINKDPNVNTGHPNDPSLFVFSWIAGTGQGYNGGNGWFNAPGCSPCVGDSLLSLVGTTHTFGWSHEADGPGGIVDGWWAFMDSTWLGAYPDTGWSSAYTDAAWVQTFGELAGDATDQRGDVSCADIGSGDVAATGTTGGRASGLAYLGTTITPTYSLGQVTWPSRYNVVSTSATAFNFGGPGSDSIGGALGSKGSCASPTAGTAPAGTFQIFKEVCPDLSTTTGCNLGQGFTTGNTTVGVCTPITGQPNATSYAVKNNAGVSGRTYTIFHTSNCTGTSRTYGNQAGEAFTPTVWGGDNIKAIKRNS